jgi:hypothetical protein
MGVFHFGGKRETIGCETPPRGAIVKKKSVAQEQAKAAVLQEAEAEMASLLDEAVAWQAEHPDATWDELELEVLQLRQRFGRQLARVLAKHRAEQQPVPGPHCAECGAEMHYKGQKTRRMVSMLGEVPLERGYYYCSRCQRSVFPPGSGAGAAGPDVESTPDADLDVAGRPPDLCAGV